jgi:HTH-type transcriptional regulator/antitoxin HigA
MSMNKRVGAEIFPPGEFLKGELEARNWSQIELSEIIGKSERLVSEIISGKRSITPESAKSFAAAFGTSPQYWMNLETAYQLSKTCIQEEDVCRRAKLYEKFPVKTMIKRGWVTASENLDVMEHQFFCFFDMPSMDGNPAFAHAAKKSSYVELPVEQIAWLARVRQIAKTMLPGKYSEKKLADSLATLKNLLVSPEEIRHVPQILADCGVRFIVVEVFPKSKIDGACFWLDDNSPVIGMSLRYDRIDNFWFVLRHEIEHVIQRHGQDTGCVDIALTGEDSNDASLAVEEQFANVAAADFCVSQAELNIFIAKVQPFFSEQKILLFARRVNTHPGIIVGQLQNKLKRYDFLKKHQVKVRSLILPSSRYDGWGDVMTTK